MATQSTIELDPAAMALTASGPVMLVLLLLVAASLVVWIVIVVKARQLGRWHRAQRALERAVGTRPTTPTATRAIARNGRALGTPILRAVMRERGSSSFLEAVAERALAEARQRASTFMTVLATIGAAAPFVGLLGTVWGILDAFLRIGREQSASLPVVAPAIGEALLATAIGLAAAIPAVVGYNFLSRRLEVLLLRVSASARVWARALCEV
jgi:biopolymer transport protein TolQ